MGTVSTFRHGCLQLLLLSTSSLLTWITFIAGPLAWLCLVNFLELSATYQHYGIFFINAIYFSNILLHLAA